MDFDYCAARYNAIYTLNRKPIMDITPPYGYQEVVPLTKDHRVVLPAQNKLPPVFRGMMVIPLSYSDSASPATTTRWCLSAETRVKQRWRWRWWALNNSTIFLSRPI